MLLSKFFFNLAVFSQQLFVIRYKPSWGHNIQKFLHNFFLQKVVYSSDGLVVRASASGAVNLDLIPNRVKPMTLKLVFTIFLLDAQH